MSLSSFHPAERRIGALRLHLVSVAIGLTLVARWAGADVTWHSDLAAASEAARGSGKPVLAIVDATWNQSDDPGSPDVFAHPEVAAVIGACFEPVRVDADADPNLTQALGVEHVPTACVLDPRGTPLARFDCPPDAAEFVAAAARAAQVAAAASESDAGPESLAAEGTQPSKKGSSTTTASALAMKVKNLAGFAETDAAPAEHPSRFRPIPVPARAENPAAHTATTTAATSLESLPGSEPALAQSSTRWPAEPAVPSAFSTFEPAPPQADTQAAPAFPVAPLTQPAPYRYPSAAEAQAAAVAPTQPTTPNAIEPAGPVSGGWLAGNATAQAAPLTTDPAVAAAPAATELPATTPAAEPAKQSATASMMAFFTKPWSMFSRPAVEPTPPPPTLPPAKSITPAAVAASAPPESPDQHGSMPLGLEGYCPVTLVERGTWVEGRAQWGVRHRGRTYLFAGPEQQQAFLASPDRYAPALSGDDPVLAFESGRTEPGRRAYGVTYQSRMYLFATPETRAAFSADPGRYTARVMIAEGLVANDGPRRF
jgi:YHS domain-containing protein